MKYSQSFSFTALLHVAAPGKELLTFLPEAELERVLGTLTFTPLTPGAITNQNAFQTELFKARV